MCFIDSLIHCTLTRSPTQQICQLFTPARTHTLDRSWPRSSIRLFVLSLLPVSRRWPDAADRSSGKAFVTPSLLSSPLDFPTTSRYPDGTVTLNSERFASYPYKDTERSVISTELVPTEYLSTSSTIVEANSASQENDDDLPTFDLVSAIGI